MRSFSSLSLEPRQNNPDEDQLWGPASWWREASAQSRTDSPARCHEAPSGQKSLCTHLPNQAPIKDHPAAHYLLLCHLFCPTSILKPQIRSAQCAILIKQKKGKLVFLHFIVQMHFWRRKFSLINRHDVTEITKKSSPNGFLVHTREYGLWKMMNFYRKCIKTPALIRYLWTSKECHWEIKHRSSVLSGVGRATHNPYMESATSLH